MSASLLMPLSDMRLSWARNPSHTLVAIVALRAVDGRHCLAVLCGGSAGGLRGGEGPILGIAGPVSARAVYWLSPPQHAPDSYTVGNVTSQKSVEAPPPQPNQLNICQGRRAWSDRDRVDHRRGGEEAALGWR